MFCSFPKGKRKFQKNSKNIQKIKNTIMNSLHGKIGWKWQRKRENKNYRSVLFLPNRLEKITKK